MSAGNVNQNPSASSASIPAVLARTDHDAQNPQGPKEARSPTPYYLQVFGDTQRPQSIDLWLGPNTIGRARSCDIQFSAENISRNHCTITVIDDEAVIADNESCNGTTLDGTPVSTEKTKIQVGQVVQVAAVIMYLRQHG